MILDWVGNHTSAQHPWFRESRSSRSHARRNWYLWRDARPDGSPPNNWVSVFGGSVWQWDAATSQYYMHTFLDSQPDLNWREPAVRAAMLEALKFWLDRGVDGFRLDAAPLFFKDAAWRDNPVNPDYRPGELPDSTLLPMHTRNQPGLHELFAELRALVDRYPGDRVLLGEFYVPFQELVGFYGDRSPELHLPLNLSLTWSKWEASTIGRTIAEYQSRRRGRGWPTTTLDTHDQQRIVARAGLRAGASGRDAATDAARHADDVLRRRDRHARRRHSAGAGRRSAGPPHGPQSRSDAHADAVEQRDACGFLDRRALVAGRRRPRRRRTSRARAATRARC